MRENILYPIVISLLTTISTIIIKSRINKYRSQRVLNVNLLILIDNIQSSIDWLEKIIEDNDVASNHIVQEINYNQILIDYNNTKKWRDTNNLTKNLLKFYALREEIMSHSLEGVYLKNHLERKAGIEGKINFKKLNYIVFIENKYKELEKIFINDNLKEELSKIKKKYNKDNKEFNFKSLKNIKINKKEKLVKEKESINNEINTMLKKNNINILNGPFNELENRIKKELRDIQMEYESIIKAEQQSEDIRNYFDSDDEYIAFYIIEKYKELYDIDAQLS